MVNLWRINRVVEATGYSRSSIYEKINSRSRYYDESFPKPIQLSTTGRGAVAWLESEVEAWVNFRVENTRSKSQNDDKPFVGTRIHYPLLAGSIFRKRARENITGIAPTENKPSRFESEGFQATQAVPDTKAIHPSPGLDLSKLESSQ
jgi:prophage regulatory protein